MLIVTGEDSPSWVQDIQSNLQATGAFAVVDAFNAGSGHAGAATPTLATLQGYTAVLTWSDGIYAAGTGDVLAQYWDGGGAVVVGMWALSSRFPLGGRFGTGANGYMLMDATAGYEQPADTLGTVLEPQSPLMTGVASLSANQAIRSTGSVINGGVVVAQWASNGRPLVVRGTKAGRPIVALNMIPASATVNGVLWTGDGAALLRNALLYSVCSPCPAGSFAAAGTWRGAEGEEECQPTVRD